MGRERIAGNCSDRNPRSLQALRAPLCRNSDFCKMDADARAAQTLAKPFKRGDLLRAADLFGSPTR